MPNQLPSNTLADFRAVDALLEKWVSTAMCGYIQPHLLYFLSSTDTFRWSIVDSSTPWCLINFNEFLFYQSRTIWHHCSIWRNNIALILKLKYTFFKFNIFFHEILSHYKPLYNIILYRSLKKLKEKIENLGKQVTGMENPKTKCSIQFIAENAKLLYTK